MNEDEFVKKLYELEWEEKADREMVLDAYRIIDTPIERHSKKPDLARNRIVELLGDLPRIELFARQRTAGWDSWGNELPDREGR